MTKVLKFNYVSIIFPAVSKVTKKKHRTQKTFFIFYFAVYGMLSWDQTWEEWGGLFERWGEW